jgi:predicted metalloprotease
MAHALPITATLLWALALSSCGGDSTGPENLDVDADGILNADDDCPNSAEVVNNVFDGDGCPDTPGDLYQMVRTDVEAFWRAVFLPPLSPYSSVTTFVGYTTPISSPCGVLPLRSAIYCPLSAGVYYDATFLGEYLSYVGDMAPAFIIGHELGHHVSWLIGWWPPLINSKEAELQADCFADSWASDADARGLLEEGDLEEAVVAVISVGDPDDTWFDPTLHGTANQRLAAFAIGYEEGAGGCTDSEFFDLFPVSLP